MVDETSERPIPSERSFAALWDNPEDDVWNEA
jgi:hypothetical protein